MLNNLKKILVVEAHPDDKEMSAGMTLYNLADKGASIDLLVCTNGELNGDASIRERESRAANELLGIKKQYFLGFKDATLLEHKDKFLEKLKRVIGNEKYEGIFVHSPHDKHQDHRVAGNIFIEHFNNITKNLFCFESPSVTTEFIPDLFIFGSESLAEEKDRLMILHESQLSKNRIFSLERSQNSLEYWGQRIMPYRKNQYAEAFEIAKLDVESLISEKGCSLVIYPYNSIIKNDANHIINFLKNHNKDTLLFLPSDEEEYNSSNKNLKLETLVSKNCQKGTKYLIKELEELIINRSIKNLFIPYANNQLDELISHASISAVREHPASIFNYGDKNAKTYISYNGGQIGLGIRQVIIE